MRIVRTSLTFLFLFCLSLPALAKDVVRVKVPAVGETFYVKLKANSLYLVDPFETLITPETEIVESCVVNLQKNSSYVGFDAQLRTLAANPCALKLRVTARDGTKVMTFIRVKKTVEIDVTKEWRKVTLGKGSYATLQKGKEVIAELDLERSSKGCQAVHDGGDKNHSSGIESDFETKDGKKVAILKSRGSWYRILPKQCKLWLRAWDGKTGTLTLLKSNKQVSPP